jgi:hypothetical protein
VISFFLIFGPLVPNPPGVSKLASAWQVRHALDAPSHAEFRTEPLLYRTLLVGDITVAELPRCSRDTLDVIASTKAALYVRNLMVASLSPTILSAFADIENLWITGDLTHVANHTLPLKHLYCDYIELLCVLAYERITYHSFSKITHLEIFGDADSVTAQRALAAFPNLSHFALNNTQCVLSCQQFLDTYNSLRAFIILETPSAEPYPGLETLADDVRFVMMPNDSYHSDWVQGALTGRDYWARADAFIARRISGEIDSASFVIFAYRRLTPCPLSSGRTFTLVNV